MSPAPQDRRRAVEQHLVSGGSICPFARPAAQRGGILFIEVPAGKPVQPTIWEAARRFCRTWDRMDEGDHALVVIGAEDPPDWEAGQALAARWQMEILVAFARVSWPKQPVSELEVLERRQNQAHLCDCPASPLHALPIYEPASLRHKVAQMKPALRAATVALEGGIFLFFGGPQYPPGDFRHLPHFAAVMTWAKEVRRAQQNQAAMAHLRRATIERHGALYDPEDPYLPLVPMVKTPD